MRMDRDEMLRLVEMVGAFVNEASFDRGPDRTLTPSVRDGDPRVYVAKRGDPTREERLTIVFHG